MTKALAMEVKRRVPVRKEVLDLLKDLTEQHGGLLKPEVIVEAARPASSPLHTRFDWDDGQAAEKYRLIQARYLLNVAVEYIPYKNSSIPARVFVNLSTDRDTRRANNESPGYRLLVDVMEDSDLKAQLLQDALTRMRSFEDKFKNLSELGEVIMTMQRTRRKISGKIGSNSTKNSTKTLKTARG